jgi:putative transposase
MAKQTLIIKLAPSPEQAAQLQATLETFNAACNFVAAIAFQQRCAGKFRLQKLVYRPVRQRFGLSAQMAIRAIAKVCGAYKRDRSKRPCFRPHGAMPFDERLLTWKGDDRVSLLTLAGRTLVPVILGGFQADRIGSRKGQADLLFRDGRWFLALTLEVPEAQPLAPTGVLGCDLGIVNLLTDSDGRRYSGRTVQYVRRRHRRFRQKLQALGTRGAKRLLRRRRRKERRFQRHVNHCLSKQIVARAKDTLRADALEELKGIRTRSTVRRSQRATFSAWAFAQLRSFIEYKARAAGVPVLLVDPRNSSRTCPACGHVDKANRKSQSQFHCVCCGCAGHADEFAALEVQRRAVVSLPYCSVGVWDQPGQSRGAQAPAVAYEKLMEQPWNPGRRTQVMANHAPSILLRQSGDT